MFSLSGACSTQIQNEATLFMWWEPYRNAKQIHKRHYNSKPSLFNTCDDSVGLMFF